MAWQITTVACKGSREKQAAALGPQEKEKNSRTVIVGPGPRTVKAVFLAWLHIYTAPSLLDMGLA